MTGKLLEFPHATTSQELNQRPRSLLDEVNGRFRFMLESFSDLDANFRVFRCHVNGESAFAFGAIDEVEDKLVFSPMVVTTTRSMNFTLDGGEDANEGRTKA